MAKWIGVVAGPDGRMYFCPCGALPILVYDPKTTSIAMVETGGNGHSTWTDVAAGVDGRIYFSPWMCDEVLVFDPASGSLSRIPSGDALRKRERWCGVAAGPDGRMYFIGPDILVLDCLGSSADGRKGSADEFDGGRGRDTWEKRAFCDGLMVCSSTGTEIPVHRCVLHSASPVLRAALVGEHVEGLTGRIEIPDASFTTVEAFTQYLYTEELEDANEDPGALLALAHKYDVQPLLRLCACMLLERMELSSCSTAVALETLRLLRCYGEDPMLKAVHWRAAAMVLAKQHLSMRVLLAV